MDYKKTYLGIRLTIQRDRRVISRYEDAFTLFRVWTEKEHTEECFNYLADFRVECAKGMKESSTNKDYERAEKLRKLIYEAYKLEAPYHFDAYCLALEYDRPIEKQFYYPRREILHEFVKHLQDMADGKLDELFLSCPPRIGKTTLLLFYTTWCMGRDMEHSNLYSSFSDTTTNIFYGGIMEILTDKHTYHYLDIFPEAKIPKGGTNAKDETVNVGRVKHYPNLTCRSLYGTLNGACDCDGILIADDLLSGIEEALNKDRLITAWGKVDNNLIPRAKETAKILWCGTRWSIADPIGLRESLLEDDENFRNRKYVVCNRPALDINEESNFEYRFGVGFSTDFYKQRRASFEKNEDMASWSAQYMCVPIEREGTVFDSGDMQYFDGTLPDEMPDRVFMAVDPAFGGGDFTAAPICVQYGEMIYVPDVVFSNEEKNVTQPLIAQKCKQWHVSIVQIEASKSLMGYVDGVQAECRKLEISTSVRSKPAGTKISKQNKIFAEAPNIREKFVFIKSGKRHKEYEKFMQNVYSFKIQGKNEHDDAPDSLSMASEMSFSGLNNNIKVFKRPF